MSAVILCECFARDGLQHEPLFIPTASKHALLERFAAIGFPRIEATSYSNPKRVPQFADASDLLGLLRRRPGVSYKATCANQKAVQRAIADADAGFGANEISLLVSATESHTQKNLKQTRAGQWANIEEMVRMAGRRFRLVGTVSVAFGCPFEGKVDPGLVADDIARFVSMGVKYVALGDTTGMAIPKSVKDLLLKIKAQAPGAVPIAHFHDSRGTGLVNYLAAYEAGVRHFDSSFGGVGGHPAQVQYGGGFTGNVCTEDLVGLFESMSIATGIDLDQLLSTAQYCEQVLGRTLYGRVTRSGLNPLQAPGDQN
ncbi:MAG: hydroxymethylglutaryl-CoA lyase [Betaproteobacteria bacterium]|nr:hydroxymethylglutaryl-CoA lyase [Betaproteobacteria bacterium]MSQ88733.1 hydroxymethylglutaryl-CoA lyase [Betaproteobacteria bacterium]